jgi:proline iminopeptidase
MRRPLGPVLIAFGLALSFAPAAAQQTRSRQGILSLDDARLFYEVVGSGAPIIVVHGGPGLDHRYLRPGLDALAVRHTLVYYDQRGTGRSSASLDPATINLDAFVADVDALREALGFEQVSVLGHSYGALIALEYARRHPDRVRSLILMNPVDPGERYRAEIAERQSATRTEADSVELAELMASEGYAARDAATLSQVYRVVFRGSMRDRDRVGELDLDLLPATARNGQDVARLLGGDMPRDGWERLADVRAPALVIHGRFDLMPVAMSSAMARTLPRGSLQILETGHFPYLEDREGLQAAVAGFFAGLGR